MDIEITNMMTLESRVISHFSSFKINVSSLLGGNLHFDKQIYRSIILLKLAVIYWLYVEKMVSTLDAQFSKISGRSLTQRWWREVPGMVFCVCYFLSLKQAGTSFELVFFDMKSISVDQDFCPISLSLVYI